MKAEEYTAVLGQTIGNAISIAESGSAMPLPQPQYKMMAMSESADASQETIAPGEITISAKINVVFELK